MKTRKSLFVLVVALVVSLGCMVGSAFADTASESILDLEASGTYADNQVLDQGYTFKQASEIYTDTTKVKIEWAISDISASFKSHKTWDPDKMEWVEAKENITASDHVATFTLTNYSSENVVASVGFAVEEAVKDTYDATNSTFANNGTFVRTPVVKDTATTYTDDSFTALAKTIKATLKFNVDKFTDLSSQSSAAKYGTFTVTITSAPKYLTFTANEADSSVTPNFLSGTWEYSTDDGVTWKTGANYANTYDEEGEITGINGTVTKIDLAQGDILMLRGTNCVTGSDDFGMPVCFSMTGSISASGDVTSLTNGVGGDIALTEGCYCNMFRYCDALLTAPSLPSTTLNTSCYESMFRYCTSLTSAPALPATTLAEACYSSLFFGCSSLVDAPVLPAKVLATRCYADMFYECSALTSAPELPATTLADECYAGMFASCASLTVAPQLPATELKPACYSCMFQCCVSLLTAPELPATELTYYCYNAMFQGCTALTSVCDLPATTLASCCYSLMFQDCQSLTAAPYLSATTYFAECCGMMFAGCTSLKVATSGEEGNKILTCTTNNYGDEVTEMFAGTAGTFTAGTPENGVTYYWYK